MQQRALRRIWGIKLVWVCVLFSSFWHIALADSTVGGTAVVVAVLAVVVADAGVGYFTTCCGAALSFCDAASGS